MTIRIAQLVLAVKLSCFACGCNGGVGAPVRDATSTAVLTLDSPASKQELDDAAKSLATSATDAARDEALSDATTAKLRALLRQLIADLHAELSRILADLQAQAPKIVRDSVDESLNAQTLSELAAAREELVGAPLRADLDALVDEAAAKIRAKELIAESDAGKLAEKWKMIAAGFSLTAIFLLGAVLFMLHELKAHRADLLKLLKRIPTQG